MTARQRTPRRPPPPLDEAALERLALRYVERFMTSRAKLARYLADKVRMRGWAGARDPDAAALAARLAGLGYVDDRAFAEAKAGALTRRGLGAGRVRMTLKQAGIGEDDAAAVAPGVEAARVEAALTLARRKRIGPFAAAAPDQKLRQKWIAALVRGGHAFGLAAAIAAAPPGSDFDMDAI